MPKIKSPALRRGLFTQISFLGKNKSPFKNKRMNVMFHTRMLYKNIWKPEVHQCLLLHGLSESQK